MRVVILGSGRGSNAGALLKSRQQKQLGRAEIVRIFSDKPGAGILALAGNFGVPATFLDPGPFKTKFDDAGEARYIAAIQGCLPGLVVLAGFMRILGPRFIDAFAGRIINLHPSLLPDFPGLDGIGQAWRSGAGTTGCTVHYVTAKVDAGPIIAQSAVRIEKTDTLETLGEKIHAAEHALLPAVVARLSMEQPA